MSSKKFKLTKETKKEAYIPEVFRLFSMMPITLSLAFPLFIDGLLLALCRQGVTFSEKWLIVLFAIPNIFAIFAIISHAYVTMAKRTTKKL